MKRYKKLVFEAKEGMFYEVYEGTNGELIITVAYEETKAIEEEALEDSKAIDEVTEVLNNKETTEINETETESIVGNYKNPPIPEGYKYVEGEWNNGFVIERASDESQFVWVPVGNLEPNGFRWYTWNPNCKVKGKYKYKFGIRNYQSSLYDFDTSYQKFRDPFLDNDEGITIIQDQEKSIIKYGGFYVSRYDISKNKKNDAPQSIKGEIPWTNLNYEDAWKIASEMELTDTIKSHLIFGAEYDSILEWFIESGARYVSEIKDSSSWGNYHNSVNSPRKLVKTGSNEKWCTNRIYDFAGNVYKWTQEIDYLGMSIFRGGSYMNNGESYCVAHRKSRYGSKRAFNNCAIRVALYIK